MDEMRQHGLQGPFALLQLIVGIFGAYLGVRTAGSIILAQIGTGNELLDVVIWLVTAVIGYTLAALLIRGIQLLVEGPRKR